MTITRKEFWVSALDRAIRTFAQALVGAIGTGAVGILDIDWLAALSIAAMAALLSVLTSIATPDTVAAPAIGKHAAPRVRPDDPHIPYLDN